MSLLASFLPSVAKGSSSAFKSTVLGMPEKFFSKIGNWIVRYGEIAGTSRAASELSRQGYHAEAKALMLELNKIRKQIG